VSGRGVDPVAARLEQHLDHGEPVVDGGEQAAVPRFARREPVVGLGERVPLATQRGDQRLRLALRVDEAPVHGAKLDLGGRRVAELREDVEVVGRPVARAPVHHASVPTG
jgi:hypothetical protein